MRAAVALVIAATICTGCAAKPQLGPSSPPAVASAAPPVTPRRAGDCAPRSTRQLAPPGDATIARIDIQGTARIDREKACAVLRSEAGAAVDEDTIARDVRELWESGFFDDVSVASERSAEGLALTFSVRERPTIAAWNIKGVSKGDPAGVKVLLGRPGELFHPASMRARVELLRQEYAVQGFRSAAIAWKADPSRPGEVDVTLDVTEGPKATLGSISIEGVSKARERELQKLIETNGGQWNRVGAIYRADSFERDRLVMAADYYDRGNIQVEIGTETLTLSADGTSLALALHISEGPVFKVGALHCKGDLAATEKTCVELLGVKTGEVFNRSRLVKGLDRVRELQARGGRGTQLEPRTDLDAKRRVVDLTVDITK